MIYDTLRRCLIVIVFLKICFVESCRKEPDYSSIVGNSMMRDSDEIFLYHGEL